MDGAAAGGRDKRWPLGDYVRRLGPPRGECGGKNDLELRAPLAVARTNASCIKFASDMYMYTPSYAGVDTHDRVDQRAGLSSRRTASGPGLGPTPMAMRMEVRGHGAAAVASGSANVGSSREPSWFPRGGSRYMSFVG